MKNHLTPGDEDPQSLAVIRIDKQDHVAEKEAEVEPDKAPSVSDKQFCTSAPLPMKYKPRGRLLKHPPGHRHSYTENTCFPPSISEDRRAPLAPPEGTASSVDSSFQLPTDTGSNVAPSECHSSVREAADPLNVSRHTNKSCSALSSVHSNRNSVVEEKTSGTRFFLVWFGWCTSSPVQENSYSSVWCPACVKSRS